MSMRCLVVCVLLGLGIHDSAVGLNVSRVAAKPSGHASSKIVSSLRQALEWDRTSRVSAPHAMRWLDGQQVEVFVDHQCEGSEAPLLQAPVFGISYAKVHYRVLEALANLDCVRQIRPPVYANRRVGSVTSAGDIVMRVDELRAGFGVDGSNIRIGVISDSLINVAASVATGDLPTDVIIVNGRDGSDLFDAIDEGRAMAELIHDLAPGAILMFHTGFPMSLDMIEAIRALTAAGAHIIVDDIGFFLEPYFEDGPVAQAVQEAIDAGVLYVTAAGNDAESNYSGTFQELNPNDDNPDINVHDFGGGDGTMGVTLPSGGSMREVLQWPNAFDGSANTADYGLFVRDASGAASACDLPDIVGICVSNDAQLTSAISPLETVFVRNNTRQSVSLNLVVNRFAGEVLPLRMVFGGSVVVDEHNVPGRSIFGHPCVSDAMTVGAIDASDFGFDTIESFSSRGPCEIFFAPSAGSSAQADSARTSQVVPLTPSEIRTKPDVVAADGTNTSLPFFSPFFGTSAAAPHAAAVAALLMDAGGGPEFISAPQVLDLMRIASVDQGPLGVDDIYGFGVVDEVQAADVLQGTPLATILSPEDNVVVATGARVNFMGACRDLDNNVPFTFDWTFVGGANIESSAAQNPSVVFSQPGTSTVTMTCTNVLGNTSLAAALRVIVEAVNRGGGGGCTLAMDASSHPLSAFGDLFLLVLTFGGWWLWRRWRAAGRGQRLRY